MIYIIVIIIILSICGWIAVEDDDFSYWLEKMPQCNWHSKPSYIVKCISIHIFKYTLMCIYLLCMICFIAVAGLPLFIYTRIEEWLTYERPNQYEKEDDKSEDISVLEKDIPHRIYFGADLPFEPQSNQVIYVEDTYNEFFNDYVRKNFKDIQKFFWKKGLTLIYLPLTLEQYNNEEAYHYLYPSRTGEKHIISDTITSDTLFKYVVEITDNIHFGPAFIRYKAKEVFKGPINKIKIREGKSIYRFSYVALLSPDIISMNRQIREYLWNVGEGDSGLYFTVKPEGADANFDEESKKLMVEIRKKIDILRSKGIEETVIKNLFGAPDQLSHLHITSDNRIFLPDYHNMEIKMKPLPKAVFFLFLNHPEGIIFKDLPDYREELTAIYSRLSAREDNEAVLKSIEDVTDPMNNSINEKCARIREAFISQFDESLACNYFITGSRGNPKKISLSRDMIIRD